VDGGHYEFETYLTRERWTSIWHQIDATLRSAPDQVLEIGVGSGVFASMIRQFSHAAVVSADFDPALNPDIVADVARLTDVIERESFDVVCAFQVLEHIPFQSLAPAVEQMAAVSSDRVLISLPHWGYPFELDLRVLKKRFRLSFSHRLTRPHSWTFDGEHYWEIGPKGYSLEIVRETIARVVDIEKEYFVPGNSYHYFLECRVKR
jgi:hypothetical protein